MKRTSDQPNTRQLRIISFIRETMRSPVDSVLDVGCATGCVVAALADCKHKVGVDVAQAHLAIAGEKGIDTKTCDVDQDPLPFDRESFDMVIATDVIEHLVHTDHLLNEINRVLRPNGTFIASIPNINQPVSLIMLALDLTPMYAARFRSVHHRDFAARLFRLLLVKHGFRVLRYEGSYIYPFRKSGLSRFLARRIRRLGEQILFACAKDCDVSIPDDCEDNNMLGLLKWLKEA